MRLHLYSSEVTTVFILSCLIAFASMACICPPDQALWEAPCGSKSILREYFMDDLNVYVGKPRVWRKIVSSATKNICQEIKMALYSFKNHEFDLIYPNVDESLGNNRQYIPSWLPGRGDVETMAAGIKSFKEVPKSLQTFYSDLQKFAVAFEQISIDEKLETRSNAIEMINNGIAIILCEAKSTLQNLQMSVPMAIQRSIMPNQEREIADNSHRLVRDYGTIKRYGDYLRQWLTLLKSVKRRSKRSTTSTTFPSIAF